MYYMVYKRIPNSGSRRVVCQSAAVPLVKPQTAVELEQEFQNSTFTIRVCSVAVVQVKRQKKRETSKSENPGVRLSLLFSKSNSTWKKI